MGWQGIPLRTSPKPRDEEKLTLFFTISVPQDAPEQVDDERLFFILREGESILGEEISRMVPAILGSIFRLEKVEVHRGSVTFWVVVAGAFTLLSQYADFVRSLELLHSQISNLIREFLAHQGISVTVTGGWTPLSGVRGRFSFPSLRSSPEFITLLLVLYLVVSHAVLLSVFIRYVWRTAPPTTNFLVSGGPSAASGAYECIERTEKQVPNFQASGTHAEVDYVLLHDVHKIYASCDWTGVSNLDSNARCGLRPLRNYECTVQPDTIEKGAFPLSDLKCKDGDGHNAYLYVSKKE
jgi:hypothetical protein